MKRAISLIYCSLLSCVALCDDTYKTIKHARISPTNSVVLSIPTWAQNDSPPVVGGITTNAVMDIIEGRFVGGTNKVNRVTGSFDNVSNRVATIEGKESGWDAKQDAIADYTTTQAVQNIVTGYGYATETWVNNKGYTQTNNVCNLITNNVADWAMAGKSEPQGMTTNAVKDIIASDIHLTKKRDKIDLNVYSESKTWTVKYINLNTSVTNTAVLSYGTLDGKTGYKYEGNARRFMLQFPSGTIPHFYRKSSSGGIWPTSWTDTTLESTSFTDDIGQEFVASISYPREKYLGFCTGEIAPTGNKLATTNDIPTIPSTNSLLKGNGSGGIVAATAGTDYATNAYTKSEADGRYLQLSGGTVTGDLKRHFGMDFLPNMLPITTIDEYTDVSSYSFEYNSTYNEYDVVDALGSPFGRVNNNGVITDGSIVVLLNGISMYERTGQRAVSFPNDVKYALITDKTDWGNITNTPTTFIGYGITGGSLISNITVGTSETYPKITVGGSEYQEDGIFTQLSWLKFPSNKSDTFAMIGDLPTASSLRAVTYAADAPDAHKTAAQILSTAENTAGTKIDRGYTPTNAVVKLSRSVQYVLNPTGVTIQVPDPINNGIRDWVVYVQNTSLTDTIPLTLPTSVSWYAADKAYTNACTKSKMTALYFTEITTNKFAIGRAELDLL